MHEIIRYFSLRSPDTEIRRGTSRCPSSVSNTWLSEALGLQPSRSSNSKTSQDHSHRGHPVCVDCPRHLRFESYCESSKCQSMEAKRRSDEGQKRKVHIQGLNNNYSCEAPQAAIFSHLLKAEVDG